MFFELVEVIIKTLSCPKQENQIHPTPFVDGGALMDPSPAKRVWGDLEPLAQNAGQQVIALNDEQVCQAA
jgi:hypothetical protein